MVIKKLSVDERFELVKKNTIEIIDENSLRKLIREKKNPSVYCGYEPNGPMHLGHFVSRCSCFFK